MKKNNIEEKNRIKGSLFGFFVGDALGVPVEFIKREELDKHPVVEMLEYGTYHQPMGTWSDDSSMVLASMDSILQNKGIHYYHMMDCFLKWFKEGKYTPNGFVFDIGNSTSFSLLKYQKDSSTYLCGDDNVYSNGNGSLMRILPISLYLHYTNDSMYDIISNISSMTHAHIYSIFSCVIYSSFIHEFLIESNIDKAYSNMRKIIQNILNHEENKIIGDLDDLKEKFHRILYDDINSFKKEEISSSGFVIDSLEACFWCLLTTNNYRDAVLNAVNLGEDTDTIGALTGGLAGLVYGIQDIPNEWISVLKRKEYLEELVEQYYEFLHELELKKIVTLWKNGLGDMNQFLQGRNPLPKKDKKADKYSFKNIAFTESILVDCHLVLTKKEFGILSMGHIPEVMEDHWFMYCDDISINYFRSWTGIQIFKGYYHIDQDTYVIDSLEINHNKNEYFEEDISKSIQLFYDLITMECRNYN